MVEVTPATRLNDALTNFYQGTYSGGGKDAPLTPPFDIPDGHKGTVHVEEGKDKGLVITQTDENGHVLGAGTATFDSKGHMTGMRPNPGSPALSPKAGRDFVQGITNVQFLSMVPDNDAEPGGNALSNAPGDGPEVMNFTNVGPATPAVPQPRNGDRNRKPMGSITPHGTTPAAPPTPRQDGFKPR